MEATTSTDGRIDHTESDPVVLENLNRSYGPERSDDAVLANLMRSYGRSAEVITLDVPVPVGVDVLLRLHAS